MPTLKELEYPFDVQAIQQKRLAMRRLLAEQPDLRPLKIAILGGATTAHLKDVLELFLLRFGFRPSFYESEYQRYYEDVALRNRELFEFRPEVVLIHVSWRNIRRLPEIVETDEGVEEKLIAELQHLRDLWSIIQSELDAVIIQNNFDLPILRRVGSLESVANYGVHHFLNRLNSALANEARNNPKLIIQDLQYLSSCLGLDQWEDPGLWFSYKLPFSHRANVVVSHSIAALICAIYGRARKCLILDLDNTLWGGVIGDDGLENIRLGRETAVGEAFLAFQHYIKQLKSRGVILAVCSKNEEAIAKSGFSHPDSILSLDDFAAFRASWNPKHESIIEIAGELNIGLESMVFIDDNAAERDLVRAQLPMVAVPEVGGDIAVYPYIIERERYFETVRVVADDVERARMYLENKDRAQFSARFSSYGEYLASLDMEGEFDSFAPVYMERIAQLTNKTNQFNLTTRRYTIAEMDAIRLSRKHITVYGRLKDKFGDNGLVSVVIAHIRDGGAKAADIDLWLMSCRVLKREMELAMLDVLVEKCLEAGVGTLYGHYLKTAKNAMVADHYSLLGFELIRGDKESSLWKLDVSIDCQAKNKYIRSARGRSTVSH